MAMNSAHPPRPLCSSKCHACAPRQRLHCPQARDQRLRWPTRPAWTDAALQTCLRESRDSADSCTSLRRMVSMPALAAVGMPLQRCAASISCCKVPDLCHPGSTRSEALSAPARICACGSA